MPCLCSNSLFGADRENTMDDKEQFIADKKHVDSSSSVEEAKPYAPIREDASDDAAECKDVVSVEEVMDEENDCNKTLDNDRVHSAVGEASIPAGVHQQQAELSEDAGIEQQEPSTDCEREETGSPNRENTKTIQYVVVTTLY
jgi:hypothetical protein